MKKYKVPDQFGFPLEVYLVGDVDEAMIFKDARISELQEMAMQACAKGMAAVACYGRRDENGLAGTSKKHYEELAAMQEKIVCICKAHPKEGFWLDIDCPYHGNRYRAAAGKPAAPEVKP